jgi:hypothetical protein
MPKAKQKTRRDDPAQSRLFIKKAREIGADEEHSGADKLLGHLARMPPAPHIKSKSKTK